MKDRTLVFCNTEWVNGSRQGLLMVHTAKRMVIIHVPPSANIHYHSYPEIEMESDLASWSNFQFNFKYERRQNNMWKSITRL